MPTTTTATTPSSAASHVALLRWVFGRNAEEITCEIDFTEGEGCDGYDVCVVPHWAVASTAIEHFDSPVQALERHAELAIALQAQGWTMLGSVTQVDPAQTVA